LWLALAGFGVAGVAAVAAAQQPGAPERSVWSGVFTATQARRGETTYAERCASCHGPTLEGGEMAPPLVGGQFNANWNGLTLGDLVERIRISMPQNNPGSLTRQQYVDVLAFMLRADGFPEGMTELPTATENLRQIGFTSEK
jgi:cytochrome c